MQRISKFIFFLLIVSGTSLFSANKDSLLKVAINPLSNDRVIFFACYELGWEYIYSNSDSSLLIAERALFYAKKLNSVHLQSKAYNLLGAYYQIKQDYVKAIDNYQKCQKLGESLNDNEAILLAYGNLGAMYLTIGQHKKAENYQLKCLLIANKTNDTKRQASIYNNLSLIYNSISFKEYDKALDYGNKSLNLYTKLSDENGMGAAYGTLGNTYFNLNKLDEALLNYTKSGAIALKMGNIYEEMISYKEIGDIYFKKKKYDLAIEYYEKAKQKSEKIDDLEGLKLNYQKLYLAHKANGDSKKALESYEKYVEFFEKIEEQGIEEELQKKELEFDFKQRAEKDSLKNVNENLKKDLSIEANKTQIEKDRILKIALAIVLALVALFAVFMANRFRIIKQQKRIIEYKSKQTQEQKNLIENKNTEILDSINYAKRIQDGILANDTLLNKVFQNYFVLFKPKDIVSGDFYWATEHNNRFYIAVCDSTGHGVPGAFMSILNIGLLSEGIKEKNIKEPNKILNYVRDRLIETISGDGQKDGMDGILMCFDLSSTLKNDQEIVCEITYAAANNHPVLIRDEKSIELEKDKMPIGKGEKTDSFTLHKIEAKKGDMLYLCTDGYADQFGGVKGKKYKYKQLNEQLASISLLPLANQKEILTQNFNNWKGDVEQIDDICIFGLRI